MSGKGARTTLRVRRPEHSAPTKIRHGLVNTAAGQVSGLQLDRLVDVVYRWSARGPVTLRDYAAHQGVERQVAVAVVVKAADLGLLKAPQEAEDGYRLSLTRKGAARAREVGPRLKAKRDGFCSGLGAA